MTEVLNCTFYLIKLINLNLTSHMWPVDSTAKLRLTDISLLRFYQPGQHHMDDPNLTKG